MDEIKFTRRELYDLVWSEPLTAIAKKFETYDYVLRKACKDFNIPLPKSGHWMKIQFGKPVDIEPLDEDYDGPNDVSLSETLSTEKIISVSVELSPLEALKTEIENDKRVSLVVPDRLTKPDKLIESLKKELEERTGYSSEGNRIKAWDQLNVLVTKALIGRALRFMDTFIIAIRARGHDIEVRNRETNVLIYSEEIQISCREKAKRVVMTDRSYNYTELRSTGILSFNIEGFYTKEWKDGKLKLEHQLSSILAKLELEGKRKREETVERKKRWAEEDRKRKIIEDIKKAKEKQLEDFKTLIENSRRHREVIMIREYIAAVEEKAKGSGELTKELKSWIQWAQMKTDWYDPFLDRLDPDLDGVDKETLTFKKSNRWS
jgi:hypothetical protein